MKKEKKERFIYERKYVYVDSFLQYIYNFSKKNPNHFFSIILIVSENDIAHSIRHPQGYTVLIENSDLPISIIKITFDNGVYKEEVKAICIKSDIPSLYIILSDYKSGIFNNILVKIFDYNYPRISRIFLKDAEIRKMISSLHYEYKQEVIVRRVLSYSRLPDGNDKDLKWTLKAYDQVFEGLDESNSLIRKIHFKTYLKNEDSSFQKIYDANISRNGFFRIKGNFERFYNQIILKTINFIDYRIKYLEKRSENAKNIKPDPIVVRFGKNVFSEEGWNQKFVNDMSELVNIGITEFHRNPYLHLSILDYSDGSSYAIWILSENEINIIPQARATVASMSKILSHIYEKINEGEIIDYEEIRIAR